MPTLEVLVGMIASGKSTYARKRAEEGAIISSDDAIVTAVHGGNYRLYDKRLRPLYKMVENQIIGTALAMGHDVVVDRTNLERRTRIRYAVLARSFGAMAEAVLFPMADYPEHARRRSVSDGRGYDYDYWLKVAQKHYASHEPVSSVHDEGFDRITEVRG